MVSEFEKVYLRAMPFRVVPEKFSNLWIGRKDVLKTVQEIVNNGLIISPTQFGFIGGRWGSGKTHLALYFTNQINKGEKGKSIYLITPKPRKVQPFLGLYFGFIRKIGLEKILKVLQKVYQIYEETDRDPRKYLKQEITYEDEDITTVFDLLARNQKVELCKRWLVGKSSKTEDAELNVFSTIDSEGMALDAWGAVLRLLTFKDEQTGEKIYDEIFIWVDNTEYLSELFSVKEQLAFLGGARELLEAVPNNLTFILIMLLEDKDEVAGFLSDTLLDRTTYNYWMPSMEGIDEAYEFIKGLLKEFRIPSKEPPDEIYPFTEESLKHLCELVRLHYESIYPRQLMVAASVALEKALASDIINSESDVIDSKFIDKVVPQFLEGVQRT